MILRSSTSDLSQGILPLPDLDDSHAFDTDSYKWSHWRLYPPGTTQMQSYFESRGGLFGECTLFGLQYVLHRYLSKPLTEAQVREAATFAEKHGEPFNFDGWMSIVRKHEGRLPIRIRAIPEGTVVKPHNAIMTVESTDPESFWLESVLETPLVRLWEPSTIAISSRESKKIIWKYLEASADNPQNELAFKLHDFGGRGVTCKEQARIAGAAHVLSFLGSDTIEGVRTANHYYHCDMAAFSIPASEHSTVTMWGQAREHMMLENFVKVYLVDRQVPPGMPKLAACVGDSYNIYEFAKMATTGRIKELIKKSGGTLVLRPDSGDPLVVLPKLLEVLQETLKDEIYINHKGFRMLPDWLRIIQGDGINIESMEEILKKFVDLKWSTANIAFGSGGGLLQRWDRDTQKWAFKCCAALVNGVWVNVSKNPITDAGKRSKEGRLDLIRTATDYETVVIGNNQIAHPESVMNTVFENGVILYDTTFDECRERMAIAA